MLAGVISAGLCVPKPEGALKTGQNRQGWDQNPTLPALCLESMAGLECTAAPGVRSGVREV